MNLTRSGLLGKLFGPPPNTPDGYVATAKASKSDGYDWEAAAGGAPTGAAGGDLGGTYPNPTLAKVGGAVLTSTAADLNLLAGLATTGRIPLVFVATWSPADVTQDETVTLLTIPAGAVTIAFAAKRATPTAAGSTPIFGLDDGLAGGFGLKVSNLALASDSTSNFVANGSSALGAQFNAYTYLSNYYNVDTALVLAYTAGVTPGTAVPVVKFRLVVVATGMQ